MVTSCDRENQGLTWGKVVWKEGCSK